MSVGSVAVITIYIIVSGAPALAEIGVGNFLFGTEWEASSEIFGILPMILSSIVGTIGAIIIGCAGRPADGDLPFGDGKPDLGKNLCARQSSFWRASLL